MVSQLSSVLELPVDLGPIRDQSGQAVPPKVGPINKRGDQLEQKDQTTISTQNLKQEHELKSQNDMHLNPVCVLTRLGLRKGVLTPQISRSTIKYLWHRCKRNSRRARPYSFRGLEAMDVTKPFRLICVGVIHGRQLYRLSQAG